MNLLETIEASKTWTCPKSGWWKVICVGGGGASTYESAKPGSAGRPTSFGTLLTANGGKFDTQAQLDRYCFIMGYTFAPVENKYGNLIENSVDARGKMYYKMLKYYGSSGYQEAYSQYGAGMCGEMSVGVFNISEGTNITCSVGAGGTVDSPNAQEYGNGRSGVIIAQYLGAEV